VCRWNGLTKKEDSGFEPCRCSLPTGHVLLVCVTGWVSFINQAVVPPVLLQEDVGKLVVELLQASVIRLIRDVLEPGNGGVKVAKENWEVVAKEGVDLLCTPIQLNREPWLVVDLLD